MEQIRIDFHVTEEIERYVYVYLIIGDKCCYIIDSGVDGAECIIEKHLKKYGKKWDDVSGLLLTHAHPDHIGAAASIKEKSGCKVYASKCEALWIENVDLEFAQRPIPNFYKLVNKSTKVDEYIEDGSRIELESGITIDVMATPGHSIEEMSYIWRENSCIFTGDAIPVKGDIPIIIDEKMNKESLEKLLSIRDVTTFYPAWDVTYSHDVAMTKINTALDWMNEIKTQVKLAKSSCTELEDMVRFVCERMNTQFFLGNPLFRKTIESMM